MKFLIITHVKHIKQNSSYFAYSPYVREMNIWLKHVDEVSVVAPLIKESITDIHLDYNHSKIRFNKIPQIEFTSILKSIISLVKLPYIFFVIINACRKTDHIHLRCPGNIGLLGCIVQILFPSKTKTAKYAGNWDPKASQPLSYKIQRRILKNTFLSKNIKVLVYGNWKKQSKNIKSFFTATYNKYELESIMQKSFQDSYNFIFVGSLVEGKNPMLCIKIVEALFKKGLNVKLDLFGDGFLMNELQDYINKNNLSYITLNGNVTKDMLKLAYNSSQFLLLPSKSEGWPKAVAEAMFFGVIPFATKVSCIGWMLDYGRRGVLIDDKLDLATDKIFDVISNGNLEAMSLACKQWSQQYTLDKFEKDIIKLLHSV